MPQITIKDIARESGVGITTVSKVINKKDFDIKESTRDRVLNIVKKLNYHPSYLASSLRSGKRNCIGVAGAAHLYDISDPVISAIYAGIGEEVETHENLLTKVCGEAYRDARDLLRVHIQHLRQKLGDSVDSPSIIVTEHGMGYKFLRPSNN